MLKEKSKWRTAHRHGFQLLTFQVMTNNLAWFIANRIQVANKQRHGCNAVNERRELSKLAHAGIATAFPTIAIIIMLVSK